MEIKTTLRRTNPDGKNNLRKSIRIKKNQENQMKIKTKMKSKNSFQKSDENEDQT